MLLTLPVLHVPHHYHASSQLVVAHKDIAVLLVVILRHHPIVRVTTGHLSIKTCSQDPVPIMSPLIQI